MTSRVLASRPNTFWIIVHHTVVLIYTLGCVPYPVVLAVVTAVRHNKDLTGE